MPVVRRIAAIAFAAIAACSKPSPEIGIDYADVDLDALRADMATLDWDAVAAAAHETHLAAWRGSPPQPPEGKAASLKLLVSGAMWPGGLSIILWQDVNGDWTWSKAEWSLEADANSTRVMPVAGSTIHGQLNEKAARELDRRLADAERLGEVPYSPSAIPMKDKTKSICMDGAYYQLTIVRPGGSTQSIVHECSTNWLNGKLMDQILTETSQPT